MNSDDVAPVSPLALLDRTRPYVVVGATAGGLKAETANVLMASGLQFAIAPMDHDEAYYQLIAEAWRIGETFITVEQDIVPHKGALVELLGCPEPWCAFAYQYPPIGLYAGMGCAKFSWTLMRAYPRAMVETGTWFDAKHERMHWCRVDGWLKRYLLERGAMQHVHGQVEHLHRGHPAHDCVTAEDLAAIAAERGAMRS